jgi:hypothetical protein
VSLIHNERLKLTAGALNTAATPCFTVGIATPLAGYLYNIGGTPLRARPLLNSRSDSLAGFLPP